MNQMIENTQAPMRDMLERDSVLNDSMTVQGTEALIGKLAPLLQSGHLNNLVDVLSALSDVVNLVDDALIQKLSANFENVSAGVFNLNNAVAYAIDQGAGDAEPPSVWQTVGRINRDPDIRRGLSVVLAGLALLGRQARMASQPMPED